MTYIKQVFILRSLFVSMQTVSVVRQVIATNNSSCSLRITDADATNSAASTSKAVEDYAVRNEDISFLCLSLPVDRNIVELTVMSLVQYVRNMPKTNVILVTDYFHYTYYYIYRNYPLQLPLKLSLFFPDCASCNLV